MIFFSIKMTKTFKMFLTFNFSYLAFLNFPLLSNLFFFSIFSGSLTGVHRRMMKAVDQSVYTYITP